MPEVFMGYYVSYSIALMSHNASTTLSFKQVWLHAKELDGHLPPSKM